MTLFLLTVFGLLLGAGIKGRMLKAGFDTSLLWSTGRRWWEVGVGMPLCSSSLPLMGCRSTMFVIGMDTAEAARGHPHG